LICVEAFERHVDTCKSGIPTPMVAADVVVIPPSPDAASKGRDRTCVDNENGSDVPGECIASQAPVAVQTDIPVCFENEQEKMILPSGSGLNLQPIYSSYGGAGSQITKSELSTQAKTCNVDMIGLVFGLIDIKNLVEEGVQKWDEFLQDADISMSLIDSVLKCEEGAKYEKKLLSIESATRNEEEDFLRDQNRITKLYLNTKNDLRDMQLNVIPLSKKRFIDLKYLSIQMGERFNDLSETVGFSAELMGVIAQTQANIDLLVIARDPDAKTNSITCTKLVDNYYDRIDDAIDNLDKAIQEIEENFIDSRKCDSDCKDFFLDASRKFYDNLKQLQKQPRPKVEAFCDAKVSSVP
jgi:hypothetical protein